MRKPTKTGPKRYALEPINPRFQKIKINECSEAPPSGVVKWLVAYSVPNHEPVFFNVDAQTYFFARAEALKKLSEKGVYEPKMEWFSVSQVAKK